MSRKLGRTNSAMLGVLREGREGKPVGESALPVSFQTRNSRTAQIEVDSITANPDQPRRDFDEAELTALTESIDRYGLLEPIGVKPLPNGLYQLAYGERRLRAVRALEHPTVTAVVLDADVPADEIALVENLLRSDLNPFEIADGFASIMANRRWSQGDISKHFGVAKSEVSRTLKILDLPVRVREEYLQVKVPMRVLRHIAGLTDVAEQISAWEAAKSAYLSAEVEQDNAGRAPKVKSRLASDEPAEILNSALPKRVARSVLTTRDALISFRTGSMGKPLAETDRAMLRAVRDAIDSLLTEGQGD